MIEKKKKNKAEQRVRTGNGNLDVIKWGRRVRQGNREGKMS